MLLNPAAVKRHREDVGHSQLSLSQAIGVAQSRISEIERTADEDEPTPVEVRPSTARKLADGLRVPLAVLRVLPTRSVA